jgi:hypothetical protein
MKMQDITKEFEEMHKKVLTALNESESTDTVVAVIVLGRIMCELAVMAKISKEDILNGIDGTYDVTEEELSGDSQEVH